MFSRLHKSHSRIAATNWSAKFEHVQMHLGEGATSVHCAISLVVCCKTTITVAVAGVCLSSHWHRKALKHTYVRAGAVCQHISTVSACMHMMLDEKPESHAFGRMQSEENVNYSRGAFSHHRLRAYFATDFTRR